MPEDDDVTPEERATLTKAVAEVRKKRGASGRPAEGIWYYVYLRPNWKLLDVSGGENLHCDMWTKLVDTVIRDRYELDDAQVERLTDAVNGVPRGRCILKDGVYELHHGDNWPAGKSPESEKKKLIGLFGLTALYIHDRSKVQFVLDEHYRLDEAERDIVREVLGEVPY